MGENREGASGRTPRRRQTLLALAAVALLLGAGAGLWAWQSGNGDAPEGTRDDVPVAKGAKGEQQTPVDGWVTIRPAGRTDLCLTDGRDRRGVYGSAVAVHLPCAGAPVPRTYLEPAGAGLYRIQWHHPELGKGCLTVMDTGPVKGMLEPRDDCAGATLFRAEPARPAPPAPTGSVRCRARSAWAPPTTRSPRAWRPSRSHVLSPDQAFVVRPD